MLKKAVFVCSVLLLLLGWCLGRAEEASPSSMDAVDSSVVPEKKLASAYPIFGLTVGTPGWLNVMGGYSFGKFGLRGEGGGLGDGSFGWQAEILGKVYQSEHSTGNISLLGGHYHWNGTSTSTTTNWDGSTSTTTSSFSYDRNYWGVGADFSLYGIFVQANLNFGIFSNQSTIWDVLLAVQPGFQIGWEYNFY